MITGRIGALILSLIPPQALVTVSTSAQDVQPPPGAARKITESFESLIEKLSDPKPITRHKAAVALGNLKNERAIKPLIEIVKNDRNKAVVIAAVRSLGRLRAAEAVPVLIDFLNRQDISRYRDTCDINATVEALGNIGDKRAVQLLWDLRAKCDDSGNFNLRDNCLDTITEALARI